jgi:hypothetical protein
MEARNQMASNTYDGPYDDGGLDFPPVSRRDTGVLPAAPFPTEESERGSGTQLVADKTTMPPPPPSGDLDDEVRVERIRLQPSVDEVLYRLSVGDERGAFLADADLEPLVPHVIAPHVVLVALRLSYLEEYVLSFVDGASTWAEILEGSPFAPSETLSALCELVDKGAITLS